MDKNFFSDIDIDFEISLDSGIWSDSSLSLIAHSMHKRLTVKNVDSKGFPYGLVKACGGVHLIIVKKVY